MSRSIPASTERVETGICLNLFKMLNYTDVSNKDSHCVLFVQEIQQDLQSTAGQGCKCVC